MSIDERSDLVEQMKNKGFRDAFVKAEIAHGILFQLQAMLKDRGWTQEKLAEQASTSQPVISKYLNGYEDFSIKTLRKLGSAFDVSLCVRWERFSALVNRHLNLGHADLAVKSYANDVALYYPTLAVSNSIQSFHDNTVTFALSHDALAGAVLSKPRQSSLDALLGTDDNPLKHREVRQTALTGGEVNRFDNAA